jgi:23S rRNA (uridine2552-2'-O)-methyltransferase
MYTYIRTYERNQVETEFEIDIRKRHSETQRNEPTIWTLAMIRHHHSSLQLLPLRLPLRLLQIRQFSKKHKSSSKQWMDRHLKDPYVRRAQQDNQVNRAYYKLEYIDQRYNLLPKKPIQNSSHTSIIVDLGASPGGWTSYISQQCETIGRPYHIVAMDLLDLDPKIKKLAHVQFIQGDFTELQFSLSDPNSSINLGLPPNGEIQLVLSDMAPNFTGDTRIDGIRSADLCAQALEWSIKHLPSRDGARGAFVGKYFSGPEEQDLIKMAKSEFINVKIVKPPASRKESSEQYLVAMNKRN